MTNDKVDLESIASETIGKIIFSFSQLELNINLCLQCAVNARDFHTVNPLVERLSFKSKIDALIEIIEIKFPNNPACISDFKSWHREIDKFRVKRNSFIHGRWTFLHTEQEIVNVAPGMVGPDRLKEKRYGVDDLRHDLFTLESIADEFNRIRKKWCV